MLPGWASRESFSEDDKDLRRLQSMTPDERLAEWVEITDLMESILRGRPDREEELARSQPLPEGWLRMVREGRARASK